MSVRRGNDVHFYLDGKVLTHITPDGAKWHVSDENVVDIKAEFEKAADGIRDDFLKHFPVMKERFDGIKKGRVHSFSMQGVTTGRFSSRIRDDIMTKGYTTVGAYSAEGKSLLMEEVSELSLTRERQKFDWLKASYIPTYVKYTKGLKLDVEEEANRYNWRRHFAN
jgi:hypothetical protein